MLSERLIVERRCAMEIVVLFPLIKDDNAELTSVSDSASRADVAGREGQHFCSKFGRCRVNPYLHRGSRYLGS